MPDMQTARTCQVFYLRRFFSEESLLSDAAAMYSPRSVILPYNFLSRIQRHRDKLVLISAFSGQKAVAWTIISFFSINLLQEEAMAQKHDRTHFF